MHKARKATLLLIMCVIFPIFACLCTQFVHSKMKYSPKVANATNLHSNEWNLASNVTPTFNDSDIHIMLGDTEVGADYPNSIYEGSGIMSARYNSTAMPEVTHRILLAYPTVIPKYFLNNATVTIYLRRAGVISSNDYADLNYYETTAFDEDTVTWNTQPAIGKKLGQFRTYDLNYHYGHANFSIPISSGYLMIEPDNVTTTFADAMFLSRENIYDYPYVLYSNVNKLSQNSTAVYLQTNEAEILMAETDISPVTIPAIGLITNITVFFNTTCTHRVNLLLRDTKSGNSMALMIVPEGNTNFGRQNVSFALPYGTTFDKVIVTGNFSAGQNIVLESIQLVQGGFTPELTTLIIVISLSIVVLIAIYWRYFRPPYSCINEGKSACKDGLGRIYTNAEGRQIIGEKGKQRILNPNTIEEKWEYY